MNQNEHDVMFYMFPLKSEPNKAAGFRVENLYKLSLDQCIFFLVEVEVPLNIKHIIAYQFGAQSFFNHNENHVKARTVRRRTPHTQRFYKKDICTCENDTCLAVIKDTHAYASSILNDPFLFASYNTGLIEFLFAELPRGHFLFENFLGIKDRR